MIFSSYDFVLLFLPITYFLFRLSNGWFPKANGSVLLLASVVFYSYWSIYYLPLLLGSIGANYLISRFIRHKFVLVLGVVLNLAILFWFKYAVFVLGIFSSNEFAVATLGDIIIPLGISFYTFQQISYLVDINRGDAKKTDFLSYAAYIALFPQLIAGPIIRYTAINKQLDRLSRGISSKTLLALFSSGMFLFAIGLFKKVVIADSLAHWANPVFDASLTADITTIDAWIGSLAYTFQLYFDFSAYSDMALGLGRMFGLIIPMNFWSPYKSPSIIAFWRRWHISLSFFVRDYIYIPLGGNQKGYPRQLTNLFGSFIIIGIWHGAGFTFAIWGLMHASLTVLAHLWNRVKLPKLHNLIGIPITFFFVHLAWVVFRAETLESAWRVYAALFSGSATPSIFTEYMQIELGFTLIFVSALVAFFAPNALQWLGSRSHALLFGVQWPSRDASTVKRNRQYVLPVLTGAALFFALSSIGLTTSTFLYFNF